MHDKLPWEDIVLDILVNWTQDKIVSEGLSLPLYRLVKLSHPTALPFLWIFVSFKHFIIFTVTAFLAGSVLVIWVHHIMVRITGLKHVLFPLTWLARSSLWRHEVNIVMLAKAYWSSTFTALRILPHSDLHTSTSLSVRPFEAVRLVKWGTAEVLRFSWLDVLVAISLVKACDQHSLILVEFLTLSALAHGVIPPVGRRARTIFLDRWSHSWLIGEWMHTIPRLGLALSKQILVHIRLLAFLINIIEYI